MNLADFVAQVEKNYVVKILKGKDGKPIIAPVTTPLAALYGSGGLIIADMLGYSIFNGAVREPFKIGITYLEDDANSYCVAFDGASQLKYRNAVAFEAVTKAVPIFSNVTISEIPIDVIKETIDPKAV